MYDVLIVGAGPAGTLLGYRLAEYGLKVLILEKEKIPRYKTCGAGITVRAEKLIPFSINEIVERTIDSIELTCKLGGPFKKRSEQPFCYMTMRDKFDAFLANNAQEQGVELIDGTTVREIIPENDCVTVATHDGLTFSALFVAGCDGANSIVARSMGLMPQEWIGAALEMECAPCGDDVLEQWSSTLSMDVGTIPGGYAWIFPKADHLSIGAGGPRRFAKQLDHYLADFAKARGIDTENHQLMRGHIMPIRKPDTPIQQGRLLLLGDAAGLLEPFSGEGIYSAAKSARIAAPVLAEAIAQGSNTVALYEKHVDREMMPELIVAGFTAKIFAKAPRLFSYFIRTHDRPWRFGVQLFRGERMYPDLTRRLYVARQLPYHLRSWNPLGW